MRIRNMLPMPLFAAVAALGFEAERPFLAFNEDDTHCYYKAENASRDRFRKYLDAAGMTMCFRRQSGAREQT